MRRAAKRKTLYVIILRMRRGPVMPYAAITALQLETGRTKMRCCLRRLMHFLAFAAILQHGGQWCVVQQSDERDTADRIAD